MSFIDGLRDGAEKRTLQALQSHLPPSERGVGTQVTCPAGHLHVGLVLDNDHGSGVVIQCVDWWVSDVPADYPHQATAELNFLRLAEGSTDLGQVASLLALGGPRNQRSAGGAVRAERRGPRALWIWFCVLAALTVLLLVLAASLAPFHPVSVLSLGVACLAGIATLALGSAYIALRRPSEE